MSRIGNRILLDNFTGSWPNLFWTWTWFQNICSNQTGVPVDKGRLPSPLLHEWVHTAPNTVLVSFLIRSTLMQQKKRKQKKLLFEKQAVDTFNIFVWTRSDSSGTGAHRPGYPPPCCMNEFTHLPVLYMTLFFSFTVHLCNMDALQMIAFKKNNNNHRQTITSHCKHFLDAWVSTLNLLYNALRAQWKSARADNQRESDWELWQGFTGGNGAGVCHKSTGSSHTALVPRLQKWLLSPIL